MTVSAVCCIFFLRAQERETTEKLLIEHVNSEEAAREAVSLAQYAFLYAATVELMPFHSHSRSTHRVGSLSVFCSWTPSEAKEEKPARDRNSIAVISGLLLPIGPRSLFASGCRIHLHTTASNESAWCAAAIGNGEPTDAG